MKKEFLYNSPKGTAFRRELRKGSTSAEAVLWKMLKNRQIDGLRFRRQFGVGPFVLDFYCPALRLCIELDGQVHFSEEAYEYDCQRTAYLEEEHGICVLRFENRKVFESPGFILEEIRRVRRERMGGTSSCTPSSTPCCTPSPLRGTSPKLGEE